MPESFDEAVREASETLDWIKDWRNGQFSPAPTPDGWTVEMHGLVASTEKIAQALLDVAATTEGHAVEQFWMPDDITTDDDVERDTFGGERLAKQRRVP